MELEECLKCWEIFFFIIQVISMSARAVQMIIVNILYILIGESLK